MLQMQKNSLMELEKALMNSSGSVEKLDGRVNGVEDELHKFIESLRNMKALTIN